MVPPSSEVASSQTSGSNAKLSGNYTKQASGLLSEGNHDLQRKVLAFIERNLREVVLVVVFIGAIFYVVSSIAKGRIREQELVTSKLKQVRAQLATIVAPVEKDKPASDDKLADKKTSGATPQGEQAVFEGAKKAFDAAVTSLSDEANLGAELAPLYRAIALMRRGESDDALAIINAYAEQAKNNPSGNPIIAELKALLVARIKGDRDSLKNLALTSTYAAAGAVHTLKLLSKTPTERTEAEELVKKVVERLPALGEQLTNLE